MVTWTASIYYRDKGKLGIITVEAKQFLKLQDNIRKKIFSLNKYFPTADFPHLIEIVRDGVYE